MSVNNKLMSVPFAQKAGSSWKYEIPQTLSSTDLPNKACYEVGFSSTTMTDIAAGGIPPNGQDMNGILNDITTAIQYVQSGSFQVYDSDFASAIGGYDKGAIINGSDGNTYQSTVIANKTDPVGGAGWDKFSLTDYLSKTATALQTVTGKTNFSGGLKSGGIDVLKVGDGGVYSTALQTLTDFKLLTNKTGTYKAYGLGFSLPTLNAPTGSGNSRMTTDVRSDGSVSHYVSIENTSTYPKLYVGQYYSGSEMKWVEGITTANIASYAVGLGIGQTWQDVTTLRAANTTYTNTTGKPIQVNIVTGQTGTNLTYLTVNGVKLTVSGSVYSVAERPINMIIPNGSTYMLGEAFLAWNELR